MKCGDGMWQKCIRTRGSAKESGEEYPALLGLCSHLGHEKVGVLMGVLVLVVL